MGQRSDFDDDEGFLANFFKRDEEVPMPRSLSRLLLIVGGVAVLAAVIAITWATWPKSGGDGVGDGSLPVVQADHDPYKVKPDEPGGMDVPNKDSTIFETLKAAQNGEGQVENLLEDDEAPVSKDALVVEKKFAPVDHEKDVVVNEAVAEEPSPAKAVIDTIKSEVAPKVSDEDKPVVKSGGGSTYIQLAAVKSDADAAAKWKQLQGKFSSLKALSLRVQKKDVAGKGTFYRVQAGPLSSDDAKTLCAKIKSAKGDCLVVK